jgi:hypothetical protein
LRSVDAFYQREWRGQLLFESMVEEREEKNGNLGI